MSISRIINNKIIIIIIVIDILPQFSTNHIRQLRVDRFAGILVNESII